jgi:trehalose-6-phosphate synthase
LSAADLGVITPLRDGMNTTSMEFVIAQQRTKHSSLVLSEFMGISQHMSDALQVNPWDLGVHHDVARSSVKSTPIAIGVRLQSVKTLVL